MADKVTIMCGIAHTKRYTKSIVADFLVDKDEENGFTKLHSDVNLLLRQKTIHRKIGLDALRDYVQNLERTETNKHDFTDDELFSMIEPKDINNLTTAYEYAKYLEHQSEAIKEKYKKMKKDKETYDEYVKMFRPKKEETDKS